VHALYTWVPIQYPVRDFATKGLVKQVPINTDLSSLLLVPDNSSCCLPAAQLYTRVPIQYPVRDFAHGARVRGKVPINTDLSSLLLVPANSLLPALHAYTGPNPVSLRDFATRGLPGARSQSILTSSLLLVPNTAAVACLGARFILGSQPVSLLGISQTAGSG
jgi:hypothetical protein